MIDDLNLSVTSDRHTLRLRLERLPQGPAECAALQLLALLDAAPEACEVANLRAEIADLQSDLDAAESRADDLSETLAAVRRVLDRAE